MDMIYGNYQKIIGFVIGLAVVLGLATWYFLEKDRKSSLYERKAMYVRDTGKEEDTSGIRADIRRKQVNKKLQALAEKQRYSQSKLGKVKSKIIQAGLDWGITRWWATCIGIGFFFSLIWVKIGPSPLFAPLVFIFFTFILPNTYLNRKINKRKALFTKYFPNAIDILVRGLRSGMPLQESIRTISTEIEAPVGPEFRVVVDQINAGLSLPLALDRAYERLPTQELRFFATIISVQEQNGGNLSEILGKISDVLRGRAMLKAKAKALSGEARMSAAIVGSLPFVVMIILYFFNRDYVSLLWTTKLGHYLSAGAGVMMFTGMYIMKQMSDLKT